MMGTSAKTAPPSVERGRFRFCPRYIFDSVLILLAVLSIVSYTAHDGCAIAGGIDAQPTNWVGLLGAYFAGTLFLYFGLAAYVLLALLLLKFCRSFLPGERRPGISLSGELLVFVGSMLLFAISPQSFLTATAYLGIGSGEHAELALSGGVLGQVLAAPPVISPELAPGLLRQLIGLVGTLILGWALTLGGSIMIYFGDWDLLLRRAAVGAGAAAAELGRMLPRESEAAKPALSVADVPEMPADPAVEARRRSALATLFGKRETPAEEEMPQEEEIAAPETPSLPEIPAPPAPEPRLAVAPLKEKPSEVRGAEMSTRIVERGAEAEVSSKNYMLPPINMLSKGAAAAGEAKEAIEMASLNLQRTLDSFGIPGDVVGYISGPRLTRYEIKLADGVNVKKVEGIADNIAMNLKALSVRVLAPIPGRDVIGVEVPNSRSEAVYLRSVLEECAWEQKKEIPLALGKDIAGTPLIIDLAKAPHLLIAGATGMGKSVCLNTIVMSLLFHFSPENLRLIMVDPKRVEYEAYKKLPHLLTPVINEAQKVPAALRWAVTEMEHRYTYLQTVGVKKLVEYNSLMKSKTEPVLTESGEELPSHLPYLLIFIDELAELRMQESWHDSETYIARIAQLGRAAGIHIIVATQRPSTNIITGVIKANLPTRIAFHVNSLTDSRVVLDVPGAEKLLDKGDMLLMMPGSMGIPRAQGALVDDNDIKKVADFVSCQMEQHFNPSVVPDEEEDEDETADPDNVDYSQEDFCDIAPLVKKFLHPGDNDNIRKALEIVLLDRKASTSYLQRRLKIGYNQAAEIIDLLEDRGIVGPPSGSGNKREILAFEELDSE